MVQYQPLEPPTSSDNCRVGDGVDELDVALLDALHLNPLASFDELGAVLDVSPVIAARRWRRLVTTGRAWVSSAPGPQLPIKAALFEAECQPGAASSVADEFAAIPQVFSVNITTGRDSIYALVVAADQPLLAELLVDTLPAVSGLNRVQSALLTQLFSGTRWRLGGLSPDQVRAVTPEPAKTNPPQEFDAFDRELFLVLQRDGRLSFRDLAAAAGRPEPTVRRRMSLLTKAGMLVFRTDFARVQAGWPTAVALKLSVTGSAVAAVGRTLVRYPETRFCVAVTRRNGRHLRHDAAAQRIRPRPGGSSIVGRTPGPGSARQPRRAALRQVMGTAARARRTRTGRRPRGPLGASDLMSGTVGRRLLPARFEISPGAMSRNRRILDASEVQSRV
jgi:DNA-binding Lrp family transcriptional regulator